MRLTTVLGAPAVAALIAFGPVPAGAAQPARVPSSDCRALAAEVGRQNVWQTTFWGWRMNLFDEREDIFVSPCFPSEAVCTAWLYWAQSDWSHNFYQNPPCQKGIR